MAWWFGFLARSVAAQADLASLLNMACVNLCPKPCVILRIIPSWAGGGGVLVEETLNSVTALESCLFKLCNKLSWIIGQEIQTFDEVLTQSVVRQIVLKQLMQRC